MVCIAGCRSYPRGDCSCLSNTLFQNLALLIFSVPQEGVLVHRLVQLSIWCINADLSEQTLHAECPGLIGNDGNDSLSHVLILHQLGEQADKGHGGG
ncbi:hypothetical protein SDC9_88236 [bioreactor metagenome]|uniref:Uncharacterized protein n=1 Tax=bioreactor metagenome TaxID=1076179 RepID=A0A644ZP16_9ZZZZ